MTARPFRRRKPVVETVQPKHLGPYDGQAISLDYQYEQPTNDWPCTGRRCAEHAGGAR